jgi:hypothetical protein
VTGDHHIDFLRLIEDAIKIDVPIRFDGVAIGLKSGGSSSRKCEGDHPDHP